MFTTTRFITATWTNGKTGLGRAQKISSPSMGAKRLCVSGSNTRCSITAKNGTSFERAWSSSFSLLWIGEETNWKGHGVQALACFGLEKKRIGKGMEFKL